MANPCSATHRSILNPFELIRKAVSLIENPLSSDYIDRHVLIINDFLEACTYAIWVRDIPYVIKLFYLLSERIKSVPQYKECFINLLRICCVPPMLIKASDVLTYDDEIVEYFTAFGYLLVTVNENDIFDLILVTLKNIFSKRKIGLCCINRRVCNESMNKSHLPDTLSELMCIVDQETYYKLLETTEYLLELDDTCKKFLHRGMVSIILKRMYPEWNNPKPQLSTEDAKQLLQSILPYFNTSMNILWRLLQIKKQYPGIYTKRLVSTSTWRSVQCLIRILSSTMTKKLKRNNLVSVILFILKLDAVNITGDTADDLAILCAAPEIETTGIWASVISYTQDIYDYNFKRLLFLVVSCFPQNPEITRFLCERKIVHSILRTITPEVETTWNEKQRCKLMKYALLTLCEIMPVTIDDFTENSGPLRLLKMIEAFMLSHVRICTMIACLHCVHRSLHVNRQGVAKIYRDNNGTDIIIELVKYLIHRNTLTKELQQCLISTFCIAEILIQQDDYYREDVIDICIKYMRRFLNPPENDLVHDPKIVITCLDFIWETLTWSTASLHYFISAGGTYTLLDIIESSYFPVQLQALGILVDLCEEGSCIPYLMTWRGKNSKTVIPLLLEIFRKENKKIGVRTTAEGIMSDIELPLMGEKQFRSTFRSSKDPNSSPAVLDLLGSVRPKIYALLHILSCSRGELVEDVNERYKISSGTLTITDEITKLLAENYLPLKLGEIWVELEKDLERAQINPLAYDKEIVSTMVQRYYKWSMHIKNGQEKLQKNKKEKDIAEEQHLYSHLRLVHLSESLCALHELRYIARCTEHVFRLMAKMKQKDQLRKTLDYDSEFYIKFHMTFMQNLNVTPVFHQKVSIRSNIIVGPNNKTTVPAPVSPSESFMETEGRPRIARVSEPDCTYLMALKNKYPDHLKSEI